METTIRIPNAEKWTEERVNEELQSIRIDAVSEDVDYLGIALIRQGLYIQLWAYWKKKFADNDYIWEQMLLIESIFEARLVQGALRKTISPWIAIFTLKNNHNWSERPASEKQQNGSNPTMLHMTADNVWLGDQKGSFDIFHRLTGTAQ